VELQALIFSVEIIVGALLAFLYIKSRLPKQTIEEQSKVIAALEKRIETMEFESKERLKKQIEDGKAIAALQGQIAVYKELPLQDIAKSLKALENIPQEFERISKSNTEQVLSAIQNVDVQNVKQQTVEHETVNARQ
jgi:16S rRNA C1402 (ribose-2'-O) methylase RsmI